MKELARVSIFKNFTTDQLEKLEKIAVKEIYKAGDFLCHEDEPAGPAYVVQEGSAEVYQTSIDGKNKRVVRTVRGGEIVGEFSVIDLQNRQATVQALAEMKVLSISYKDFHKLGNDHPDILWKVLESLCKRLRDLSDETVDITFRDVPYRLLRLLVELAEAHGEAKGGACKLGKNLSPHELANRLGSSPELVGRAFDRLRHKGLVDVDAEEQVLIPDLRALRRALDYPD